MQLLTTSHPAKTTKSGTAVLEIPAGKNLKIETTPEGEEILNVTVPTGKKWTVNISVSITETSV